MAKEIMVCNTHDTPLIWTFVFPYAEYFCMAGNHSEGMLGAGYKVELTPELEALNTLYHRRWGQLKRHIVAGRFWRKDCAKCNGDEYHNEHLTDQEVRRSKLALQKLQTYANETHLQANTSLKSELANKR